MICFSEPFSTEINFDYIEAYKAKCLLLGQEFKWVDILGRILNYKFSLAGVLKVDNCIIYSYYRMGIHMSLLHRDNKYIIINPDMQELSYKWEYNDVNKSWYLKPSSARPISVGKLLRKFET